MKRPTRPPVPISPPDDTYRPPDWHPPEEDECDNEQDGKDNTKEAAIRDA